MDASGRDWMLFDSMRDQALRPNLSSSSSSNLSSNLQFEPRGFRLLAQNDHNVSGETTVFMAIRRPHKPPEAATDVFAANVQTSPTYSKTFTAGFPVDLAILYDRNTSRDKYWFDRLRGNNAFGLESTTTDAESSFACCEFDRQTPTIPPTVSFSGNNILLDGVSQGAVKNSALNIGNITGSPFDSSGNLDSGETITVGAKITIDRNNERILIAD